MIAMDGTKKRKRTGAERDRRRAELAEKQVEKDNVQKPAQIAPKAKGLASAGETEESQRITERIPLAIKHLRGVFKQAKKWETGRLVKKIKGMRSKTDKATESKELESQLALLSHIRVTPLIQHHLQSKLARLPQFRHSALPPSIFASLALQDEASTTTAKAESSASPELRAKVENRLLSAKGVGAAVVKVVDWLVSEEGTKLNQVDGAGKLGKRKRADSSISLDVPVAKDDSPKIDKDISGEVLSDVDEDLDDLASDGIDEEVEADDAGWESGSISNGSSDGEDEDVDEDYGIEDESEEAIVPSRSTPAAAKEKPPKGVQKASAKDLSSSLFLPSLASGFTRGNDSDSDPDLDVDETGTIGKAKRGADRKNRRGQRARQAIWEKKFGKHAKHVQTQRKEEAEVAAKKAERAEKRAAKYEARGVPAAARGGSVRHDGPRSFAPALSTAASGRKSSTAIPSQGSGGVTSGGSGKNVHPSWEAAKLRKKQESAAVNAPKATKIVFD